MMVGMEGVDRGSGRRDLTDQEGIESMSFMSRWVFAGDESERHCGRKEAF